MKRLSLILCMFVLTIFVAGCNNNDDEQKNQTNDNQATENNNMNDTTSNDTATNNNTNNNATNESPYPFKEFDLEVKYDNLKEYEASYENDSEGVDASIEDDLKNERVKGKDAVDRLDPIFKKLDIDASTSKDEVISKVVSAFELDEKYQSIGVDITFNDGTEKEYINSK